MELHTLAEKLGVNSSDLIELFSAIGDEKVSFPDLLKKTNFSKETLKKFKVYFADFLLPIPNFFVLNENGKKIILDLQKKKISFTHEDEVLIRKILAFYNAQRPKPKREYDQFYSTVDTQVARIKLFCELEDVAHSDFLFLGDDDITSICLSIIGGGKRICVCDIDQNQLNFIDLIAKSEKLKIELYHADLIKELPAELSGKFDVTFTDPPYTPNGFELFLNREMEAQKNELGTYYICYGTSERAMERFIPIQKIISDYNLAIAFAYRNFNKYTGAESIGSSSNLYVLKNTPATKHIKKVPLDRIYTYE